MSVYSRPETQDRSRVRVNDVVCDTRDAATQLHPANRYLTSLIIDILSNHETGASPLRIVNDRNERFRLARELVRIIKENYDGRFLARTTRGTLKEMSNELAMRWTSGALRRSASGML